MITFLLNDQLINTHSPPGMTLLDFVRIERNLKGTKIGCREGDCGACTMLCGEVSAGKVTYKSINSCLTPLAKIHGKHAVSIEGLNMPELIPSQRALVTEGGSQCGFCTPGFVVSLSGEILSSRISTYNDFVAAVDGNICRCTGYKSIERACRQLASRCEEKDSKDPVGWCTNQQMVPKYFSSVKQRLEDIPRYDSGDGQTLIGGGTDLLVQNPEKIFESSVLETDHLRINRSVVSSDELISIGAGVTATELMESEVMINAFPRFVEDMKLIASTPIRNMATIGGNLVNASPIGDFTIFLLALDSFLIIKNFNGDIRELALRDFFLGYKVKDLNDGEFLDRIVFKKLPPGSGFSFEKVSKRTYLDIASVNTAMSIEISAGKVVQLHLSAGGVGPIPKYLNDTCKFLIGRELTPHHVSQAMEVMQGEISPISDARGSTQYKRLLLRQLFWAHFMKCFPDKFELSQLPRFTLKDEHD